MTMNEEQLAADAIGEILTSTLLQAVREDRRFLYAWERDGLQWLIRFKVRNPNASYANAWIAHFLWLNKDAILAPAGSMPINYNLRDNPIK